MGCEGNNILLGEEGDDWLKEELVVICLMAELVTICSLVVYWPAPLKVEQVKTVFRVWNSPRR